MKRNMCIITLVLSSFMVLVAQESNQNLSSFDYSSSIEVKKKAKLNDSPYAIFGDNTTVLKTDHEQKKDHSLKIPIIENSIERGVFELDFETGIASIFDMNRDLIVEQKLSQDQLARFMTMDPMSEKYYSISPYAYVANNPLRFIDPDGRLYTDYVDKDGVRQVKTNDATPDRIETTLPEMTVVGKAIQKPSNGLVAISYNIISGDAQAGVAGEAGISRIYILKGPDAGQVFNYSNETQGVGGLGTSLTTGLTLYNYYGNIENFTKDIFQGESNVTSSSYDIGISAGFGTVEAKNPVTNETLRGHTISLGFGLGLPMNGYVGTTNSYRHLTSPEIREIYKETGRAMRIVGK